MSNLLATNSQKTIVSKKHFLQCDREGFPIEGQVPLTYQMYTGDGDETISISGKNYLILNTTLSAGPLVIDTFDGFNNLGRQVKILSLQPITNNIVLNNSPSLIYVSGEAAGSNNYTISSPKNAFSLTLDYAAESTIHLNGDAIIAPSSANTIYTADDTLTGNREVDADGNNFSITSTKFLTLTGTNNATISTLGDITLTANGDVKLGSSLDTDNGLVTLIGRKATGELKEKDVSSIAGESIYTTNGSLSGDRTVDIDGNDLTIDNSGTAATFQVNTETILDGLVRMNIGGTTNSNSVLLSLSSNEVRKKNLDIGMAQYANSTSITGTLNETIIFDQTDNTSCTFKNLADSSYNASGLFTVGTFTSGQWLLDCTIFFEGSGASAPELYLNVRKNSSDLIMHDYKTADSSSALTKLHVSGILELATGNTIDIRLFSSQDGDVVTPIELSNYCNRLSLKLIS